MPTPAQRSHKEIIRKCNSLRKLTSHFIDDEFMELVGQKVELEELTLSFCYHYILNHQILWPIRHLKEIRKITFIPAMTVYKGHIVMLHIAVTMPVLIYIVSLCTKLESLSIGGSRDIRGGYCFETLSGLKNFKELRISGCPRFQPQTQLAFLRRLDVLSLSMCNLGDDEVIPVLRECQILSMLNLRGTLITNETITVAIEETKKRTNGICLKLDISWTNTDINAFTETPPLLELTI